MQNDLRIRYAFKKILTGSDLSRRRLPFMSAEATAEGPTLWLTACSHGDEAGGIVIIQEIFKKIKREHILKKGSIYAFPLMNPIGFETGSRHIPFSKEDLNRSFPGNPKGSLGERIAHIIFTAVMEKKPTFLIDLHNDWISSIPYALIEPKPDDNQEELSSKQYCRAEEKSDRFAFITGLPVVRDSDVIPGSLAFSLMQNGVPSLTLEMGESYVINEINIALGVQSILNVMATLDMIGQEHVKSLHLPIPGRIRNTVLEYSAKPFSSTSGIIRFMVQPGNIINKNQPIAKIFNTFGKHQETLKSVHDGFVLGLSESATAFPGMPVMAIGVCG